MSKTLATATISERITVREFMNEMSFVSCNKFVNENTNNYPFVTFIDDKNVATNIYFSISQATQYAKGDEIAKGFFRDLRAIETVNADGENRWKLCSASSARVDIDDLF
jgi:hypothetical protein